MAKKPILLRCIVPKGIKPYTLLPFGLYCNRGLQNARIGDVVEFQTDWRIDKRRLVRKCKVEVNSGVFTFLLKSLYGERTRWEDLHKRWEAECIIEGLGRDAFSKTEVILIEVEEIKEEDE
ncbi:MAG: hypothetical protein NC209_03950 [Alistipes sp.]|nr:hypothetical protein [Lachnospiraceae bacterium]MCM1250284.1 hypothetical protein [Alistipes sp.]